VTVVTITYLERRGDAIQLTVEFVTGTDTVLKHYAFHITEDITLAKARAFLKLERDRIDALTAQADALQPYVGTPLDLDE